jgi:hypothetical protein
MDLFNQKGVHLFAIQTNPKGMLNILDSSLLKAHLHSNFFVHVTFL